MSSVWSSNPALSATYFSVDDLEFIDGWADVYLLEYSVRISGTQTDSPETAVIQRRGGATYRVNVTRGGQVMLSSGPTGMIALRTVEEALSQILDLDDARDAGIIKAAFLPSLAPDERPADEWGADERGLN